MSSKIRTKNPPPAQPRTTSDQDAATITSFTQSQHDTLTHLSTLLHLFHHRNKNQHRRSTWYRHFATFRRQLGALLADISTLRAAPATHAERVARKKRDGPLKARISERLDFWRDVCVAKWHRAFSQVVADGRFAVLGVVLMAVLGEACAVVGVTERLEGEGEEEVRGVIEAFGREVREEGILEGGLGGKREGQEDVGVQVVREGGEGEGVTGLDVRGGEGAVASEGAFGDEASLLLTKSTTDDMIRSQEKSDATTEERPLEKKATKRSAPAGSAKPAKKTKKRRKGDAIDDLFRGLG